MQLVTMGGAAALCLAAALAGAPDPVPSPSPVPSPAGPHADLACASCHAREDEDAGGRAVSSRTCLGCHDTGTVALWPEGAHARHEVGCAGCHAVHRPAAGTRLLRAASEAQACQRCHAAVRARTLRASRHPLPEGRMSCGSCHDPHGSTSDGMLRAPTVAETCQGCHAETRGPFLWEHAPATEDCGTCHEPHGSSHRPMLVSRVPWLCQRCHVNVQHPSALFDASNTGGRGPLARAPEHACTRCHRSVHGSSHPSGAYLER